MASACGDCNPSTFQAERMDAWNIAYNTISGKAWGDDIEMTPLDILQLARFLDGMD